jgi:UPF0716 family protein affecting phage T7 exclusion
MELTLLFVYALPIVTVLALGLLGTTRRLGFWWTALLSIVLTPIGGFIAAQLSGPRKAKRRAG